MSNKVYKMLMMVILIPVLVLVICNTAGNVSSSCTETRPTQTEIQQTEPESTQTEPEIQQTEPETVSTDATIQTGPTTETESSVPDTEPQPTEADVWAERYAEYPVATEAWLAMKEFGWSDIVCAGIMGNLMRETGGDTFNIKPWSSGSSGLGLAQWMGQRRIDICNKYGPSPTVAEQMEFIRDELFGSNGVRKQVTDWQRARIFEADTPEKCAAEFARWFERPAETTYSRREACAGKAYDYFRED